MLKKMSDYFQPTGTVISTTASSINRNENNKSDEAIIIDDSTALSDATVVRQPVPFDFSRDSQVIKLRQSSNQPRIQQQSVAANLQPISKEPEKTVGGGRSSKSNVKLVVASNGNTARYVYQNYVKHLFRSDHFVNGFKSASGGAVVNEMRRVVLHPRKQQTTGDSQEEVMDQTERDDSIVEKCTNDNRYNTLNNYPQLKL
jgi:hypothetical protein